MSFLGTFPPACRYPPCLSQRRPFDYWSDSSLKLGIHDLIIQEDSNIRQDSIFLLIKVDNGSLKARIGLEFFLGIFAPRSASGFAIYCI